MEWVFSPLSAAADRQPPVRHGNEVIPHSHRTGSDTEPCSRQLWQHPALGASVASPAEITPNPRLPDRVTPVSAQVQSGSLEPTLTLSAWSQTLRAEKKDSGGSYLFSSPGLRGRFLGLSFP